MERDVRARGEVVPSRMKPVGMLTAMNLCILVVVTSESSTPH